MLFLVFHRRNAEVIEILTDLLRDFSALNTFAVV